MKNSRTTKFWAILVIRCTHNDVLRILIGMATYGLFIATAAAVDVKPVRVIRAKPGPAIENIQLSGTITSEYDASLSTQVSGLVNQVNVDSGNRVNKGDSLIELDSELANLDLKRAAAALAEARAKLKEAIRLRDEARNLRQNANIPRTTVFARASDVDVSTAVVARLEAEYGRHARIVKQHSLVAPFAGVISRRLTDVGEWVSTGSSVLELVATDRLRVDLQAPQKYFSILGAETPVTLQLDAQPERGFPGKIKAIVPITNRNARTFLVRVSVDAPGDFVIPGMSVKAFFKANLSQEMLTLPRDATVKQPDGRNSVWVVTNVNGEWIVSERNVEIGRSLSNTVIVHSGLNADSYVVIQGIESLLEGQPVRILESPTLENY